MCPQIRSSSQTTVLITGTRNGAQWSLGSKCHLPIAHRIIHKSITSSCKNRRSSNPFVITKLASHSPCLFTLPRYNPHEAPYGTVSFSLMLWWHLTSVRCPGSAMAVTLGQNPPSPRWKEGNQNTITFWSIYTCINILSLWARVYICSEYIFKIYK